MVTKVIAYTRVSTNDQEYGIGAQRAKLTSYADAMGLEIVEWIEDNASGRNLDRPGIQRALSLLGNGPEGILVAKIDRLTRSVRDLTDLVELYFVDRYTLLSVGDAIDTRTATGRLVIGLIGQIAQWERETIAERTRDGLREAQRRGVRLGRVAYADRAVIDRMCEMRARRCVIKEICAALDADGIPAPQGGRWNWNTVREVLKREGM